jgi:FixJ family two-component response regulator
VTLLCAQCRNALDVDEVAVDRACRGDRTVPLSSGEMRLAFEWLTGSRLSAQQIATRLGVSKRTVDRWRAGMMPRGRR